MIGEIFVPLAKILGSENFVVYGITEYVAAWLHVNASNKKET